MKKLLTCLAMILVSAVAMADTRPVNASITPDLAIYDRGDTIEGVTFSIWGENEQTSLALGLVNGTIGDSAGVSIGIVNYGDNYTGIQWGLVNYVSGDFTGWQGGFLFGLLGSVINCTDGTMSGFQSGFVNYAGRLTGLQLGFINYAVEAETGIQIGLINVIRQNQYWFTGLPDELAPAMVLVNWRF
jgi:hypothetical protein